MAEFKVVLDGLDLDEATTTRINDDIQKVVLGHLADIDLTVKGGLRGVAAFRPRPDWYGIWIKVLDQQKLLDIPEVNESIERYR